MTEFPQTLYVAGDSLIPYVEESWESITRDPRGLLLMFEPPRKGARYIMGMDPTQGITGWSRSLRVDGDHKVDNCAIEIFAVDEIKEDLFTIDEKGDRVPDIDPITRRQKVHYRDLQVAEWAGPVDAVEAARIANLLGRIYAGDAEDQCELIFEAWPGPGLLTTQELLRLNYSNLWHWEYIDSVAEETQRIGWRSTRESQKLLWYRARRHLMNKNVRIQSRFLLDEYANAEIDLDKMRARAAYGFHDDRFMAANLCFWAGHAWTYDPERSEIPVLTSPVLDYQSFAPTLGEESSFKSWREHATDGWED